MKYFACKTAQLKVRVTCSMGAMAKVTSINWRLRAAMLLRPAMSAFFLFCFCYKRQSMYKRREKLHLVQSQPSGTRLSLELRRLRNHESTFLNFSFLEGFALPFRRHFLIPAEPFRWSSGGLWFPWPSFCPEGVSNQNLIFLPLQWSIFPSN